MARDVDFRRLAAAVLATAAFLSGSALAKPTADDRAFVAEAAAAGAAEVAMGKVASKRAAESRVREFGKHMVHDHSKTSGELKRLAAAQGIKVNEAPNPQQKETLEKLQKMSGRAFDKEYSRVQREEHDKAVALFRRQAEHGGDASLKQFAAKTLPTLEMHRKMAGALPQ